MFTYYFLPNKQHPIPSYFKCFFFFHSFFKKKKEICVLFPDPSLCFFIKKINIVMDTTIKSFLFNKALFAGCECSRAEEKQMDKG